MMLQGKGSSQTRMMLQGEDDQAQLLQGKDAKPSPDAA
jgi:hypothetical protein